jgi:hypothetical protein
MEQRSLGLPNALPANVNMPGLCLQIAYAERHYSIFSADG